MKCCTQVQYSSFVSNYRGTMTLCSYSSPLLGCVSNVCPLHATSTIISHKNLLINLVESGNGKYLSHPLHFFSPFELIMTFRNLILTKSPFRIKPITTAIEVYIRSDLHSFPFHSNPTNNHIIFITPMSSSSK